MTESEAEIARLTEKANELVRENWQLRVELERLDPTGLLRLALYSPLVEPHPGFFAEAARG